MATIFCLELINKKGIFVRLIHDFFLEVKTIITAAIGATLTVIRYVSASTDCGLYCCCKNGCCWFIAKGQVVTNDEPYELSL